MILGLFWGFYLSAFGVIGVILGWFWGSGGNLGCFRVVIGVVLGFWRQFWGVLGFWR